MKYAAQIEIHRADGRREAITLDERELANDRQLVDLATRFYAQVGGTTRRDVERLGVFAAAALLDAGDEAKVTTLGTNAKGETAAYQEDRARRDRRGRFVTTLGSRFNERAFRGV